MNLKWVEEFLMIAETRSMSVAAQKLFVSQPTLSKDMDKLENYVGAELLNRTRNGTWLTEEGRLFLPYAEKMVFQRDSYFALRRKHMGLAEILPNKLEIVISPILVSTRYKEIETVFRQNTEGKEMSILELDYLEAREYIEEHKNALGIVLAPRFFVKDFKDNDFPDSRIYLEVILRVPLLMCRNRFSSEDKFSERLSFSMEDEGKDNKVVTKNIDFIRHELIMNESAYAILPDFIVKEKIVPFSSEIDVVSVPENKEQDIALVLMINRIFFGDSKAIKFVMEKLKREIILVFA